MALFDNFPYTNFHDMNLDYLLKTVKELSDKVSEFEELLATGPVVDVKTKINGASTSIKNGSGIANLPAASDTTDGVIGLDAISDDVLRISGAETFEVPILTGGKIDSSQIDAVKDFVTLDDGDWVSCVDSDGRAQMPAATAVRAGGIMYVPAVNSNNIYAEVLSGETTDKLAFVQSGDTIDASLIPPTGVTAGTYGQVNPSASGFTMNTPTFTVGADGRITNAQERLDRIYRTAYGTIAAGASTTSLYFNLTNGPWYNNGSGFNVDLFEVTTTGKGDPMLVPLVLGTDYNYNIVKGSTSIVLSPTLTATKSNPVAVVVNGSYGEYNVM